MMMKIGRGEKKAITALVFLFVWPIIIISVHLFIHNRRIKHVRQNTLEHLLL